MEETIRQLILGIVLIVFALPDVALPFQNNKAPDVTFLTYSLSPSTRSFPFKRPSLFQVKKIVAVDTKDQVFRLVEPTTKRVDLRGMSVFSGLIASHVYVAAASTHKFDHMIPTMQTIEDVLAYIKNRADLLEDGE